MNIIYVVDEDKRKVVMMSITRTETLFCIYNSSFYSLLNFASSYKHTHSFCRSLFGRFCPFWFIDSLPLALLLSCFIFVFNTQKHTLMYALLSLSLHKKIPSSVCPCFSVCFSSFGLKTIHLKKEREFIFHFICITLSLHSAH